MAAGESGERNIDRLLDIMAALRTPVTGCPWDLEQSFATIAPYTIEEAYEVAEAIGHGDMEDLQEELGDLLLQVVYHARMAEERDAFTFEDVVDGITEKMIRRHPHVFGDDATRAAVDVVGLWERIKAEEKAERVARRAADGGGAGDEESSVLDGVPLALPALTRAVKLQGRAAGVGFDWPDRGPVLDKAREELAELEAVLEGISSDDPVATDRVAEEFGDLLLVLANLARHLNLDPEAALRAANGKFARRFGRVEQLLKAQDKRPEQSDLAEMDGLWDQVKAEERSD